MKRIQITPDIQSKIEAAVGAGTDTSEFAVFECIACNTRPFTGFKGTINEGAKLTYLTLAQAANVLQAGDSVPMIWSHEKSSMPVGRVFWGEVAAASDGEAELRTLFYTDGTEPVVTKKIEASSIDEVSVGMSTTQMLCSECGFDYQGPDASSENIWARTCGNGHTIGTDGVHLSRSGLDAFIELSLVTRGAANGAKIVSLADAKLARSTPQMTRLAARGFDVDSLLLCASATPAPAPAPKKDNPDVDLNTLNASLVEQTVQRQMAERSAADLTATLATRDGELTAARARIADLEAAVPADKAAVETANAFLKETFVALAAAAGTPVADADVPTDAAALVAGIKGHQSKLTALIPTGGRSEGADKDEKTITARVINTRAFTGKKD